MADTATPARRTNWPAIYVAAALVLGAALGFLIWATPVLDGEKQWFDPMIPGGWMAWTFPTAMFFLTIAFILSLMSVWEYASPGGNPRVGILRFETTRGDRLFITLLGTAFIHLGWLFFAGPDMLWGALLLSLVYAAAVFRWV